MVIGGGYHVMEFRVTSLAEVWIEIRKPFKLVFQSYVTSLAEVWIEMVNGFRAVRECRHFPCGSVD